MFDPDPTKGGGMQLITEAEAPAWNEKNFGIFWTVNEFRDSIRKNSHVTHINAWAIDIDNFDKRTLLRNLAKSPLSPSRIIETSSGLHVYWNAAGNARPEAYTALVQDRLGYYFEGDPRAKDLARVLRVPGFYHCKDPLRRFLVRTIFEKKIAYTEDEMTSAFKLPRMHELVFEQKQELRASLSSGKEGSGGKLFDKIWVLDQMDALRRLSGTEAVKGEQYTFKRTSNGHYNILVNGKGTSCFIDRNLRIGSTDGGGPTIANWLRWFGHSWRDTIKILKQIYPELLEEGDLAIAPSTF